MTLTAHNVVCKNVEKRLNLGKKWRKIGILCERLIKYIYEGIQLILNRSNKCIEATEGFIDK